MKVKIVISVTVVAVFVALAVALRKPSPEQEYKTGARNDITACWVEQARKSRTPYEARTMAKVCESYEAGYLAKYQEKP